MFIPSFSIVRGHNSVQLLGQERLKQMLKCELKLEWLGVKMWLQLCLKLGKNDFLTVKLFIV